MRRCKWDVAARSDMESCGTYAIACKNARYLYLLHAPVSSALQPTLSAVMVVKRPVRRCQSANCPVKFDRTCRATPQANAGKQRQTTQCSTLAL